MSIPDHCTPCFLKAVARLVVVECMPSAGVLSVLDSSFRIMSTYLQGDTASIETLFLSEMTPGLLTSSGRTWGTN